MKNAIINLLDKKVCTLDEDAKQEISDIIDALTECEPIDIAVDISEIDIFSQFDADIISVMIEEKIINIQNDIKVSLHA
jgi:hypothetical protein